MGGRGWAWTAYDWDEGRLFNYIGDAQNTYPIWNATPLVALDVYEHAYFLDYQTDRGAYIDAFFANLDWAVVNDWVSKYQIPLETEPDDRRSRRPRRLPAGVDAVRLLARAAAQARGRPHGRQRQHRRHATSGARTARRYGIPIVLLDVAKGFVPALVGTLLVGELVGVLAGGAAMLGHWRPLFLRFQKGGKTVATAGGDVLRRRAAARADRRRDLGRRLPRLPLRLARVDGRPASRCPSSRSRSGSRGR